MPTILVIEDEPDQNRLIKLRLEARGYTVLSVGKAKEGIELARKEKPALILMDMILPDMHGLQATIKLKRTLETRNIPVIGLSAVGSPDFIKACSQEGIVAYIRKPYDPRELFKTIEKYVKIEGEAKKTSEEKSLLAEKELKKKKPEQPPQRQKIEEMLRAALADFKIPLEKRRLTQEKKEEITGGQKAKPKSILIVDDDTAFGRSVTTSLTSHGYDVMIALDGVSGLKHAFQRRPDLVLLNLVLPGGGGETVLASLRKAPETHQTPVFIMSSLLSPKNLEEKAKALGAQGFIAKPVEPADLLYIIESIVGD